MMNKSKTNNKYIRGVSLVEMIIYIVIFSMLSIVVFRSILSMTQSFQAVAIDTEIMKSSNVMERMSREIRQSTDVVSLTSDAITLNTTNQAGDPKTVRFALSGTDVNIYENGVLIGKLNSENTAIENLSLSAIATAKGKAVRVSFTARAKLYGSSKTEPFQNTIVLRGAY